MAIIRPYDTTPPEHSAIIIQYCVSYRWPVNSLSTIMGCGPRTALVGVIKPAELSAELHGCALPSARYRPAVIIVKVESSHEEGLSLLHCQRLLACVPRVGRFFLELPLYCSAEVTNEQTLVV